MLVNMKNNCRNHTSTTSSNAMLKKWHFKDFLNTSTLLSDLSSLGNSFHNLGPIKEKAPSERLKLGLDGMSYLES